jgi:DNA-binding winged helix-turn-helix (wHTH) protein
VRDLNSEAYSFGPFLLNPADYSLTRNGVRTALTPREFDLLHLLVRNAGTLLTVHEIMDSVWAGLVVEQSNIYFHISQLRRLLGEDSHSPRHIETIARRGYRFKGEVTIVSSERSEGLRVFLCHASNDKTIVRELYERLVVDGIDPWLDEESLLPGQDWPREIQRAVRSADIVIVCLSNKSTTKSGFVQTEIKYALDIADEQPEGKIFLIPLKLEECIVPDRLRHLHWVNFFEERGYQRLLGALKSRVGNQH